ncbi:hypothetical protein [Mucilaginibacter sp.]|jgi:hypothetical protein|uniref:hypothetical protein n=1 Tax=Mucilaginibacter sp. TaxID=1882438 RepID=UPI0026127B91|nr:hypothetical protein [Mucilaginibacter sp.]MDB4919592.1 hypothetical protein [Mucilaginibacter sp.]
MSFINELFTFKGLLANSDKTKSKEEPNFPGHGRLFKVFHPLDIYRYGGLASFDTTDDQTRKPVDLMCKESREK